MFRAACVSFPKTDLPKRNLNLITRFLDVLLRACRLKCNCDACHQHSAIWQIVIMMLTKHLD